MSTTSEPLVICGIAGSLRRESYNRALLRAAQELAPESMEIRIFDRLAEIPLSPALPQPEILVYRAHEKFDADGRLTDGKTREFVGKLLVQLADWTRRLRQNPTGRSQ